VHSVIFDSRLHEIDLMNFIASSTGVHKLMIRREKGAALPTSANAEEQGAPSSSSRTRLFAAGAVCGAFGVEAEVE
jgi:hypothetical protein